MERITRKIGESIDFVDGKGYAKLSHEESTRLIFERLTEYEDIGLSPEEIKKIIYGGVPEWIPKYMEYRELEYQERLIRLPCKVKEIINLFSSLKYPDKLFIYDDKELVWQGYISEKQIYKHLENKEVVEIYLGEDGLITMVN